MATTSPNLRLPKTKSKLVLFMAFLFFKSTKLAEAFNTVSRIVRVNAFLVSSSSSVSKSDRNLLSGNKIFSITCQSYRRHHRRHRIVSIYQNEDSSSNGELSNSPSSPSPSSLVPNDLGLEIVRGDGTDELSEEVWKELEEGAPSEWDVMKNLLGINIFTYVLAALILFFLTMNAIAGPGWLGQSVLGLDGVGTFTEVSDSLPMSVDLSRPENLL